MRLWRKRENAEALETEASAPAPGEQAAPVEAGPAPVEATPDAEAAEDPALPGTAGYPHRQKGDVMPGGFKFVRPDGQPEPKEKRNWLFG